MRGSSRDYRVLRELNGFEKSIKEFTVGIPHGVSVQLVLKCSMELNTEKDSSVVMTSPSSSGPLWRQVIQTLPCVGMSSPALCQLCLGPSQFTSVEDLCSSPKKISEQCLAPPQLMELNLIASVVISYMIKNSRQSYVELSINPAIGVPSDGIKNTNTNVMPSSLLPAGAHTYLN